MFTQWCVLLGLVSWVAGGVVTMQEELPADIAADNAYLDEFAANAPLSAEERKIVALLERIESKFGTLQDNEKDEFVTKISNYQDRFASTLAKVETIPGMYGLNVDMLRANLGISAAEEHVEEIHEDFEDVIGGTNIPEATVEDETVVDVDSKASEGLDSMARKAQRPRSHKKKASTPTQSTKPKKTMDDLYNVMAQLVNLVMVQIVQANNKPEPRAQLPFFPPASPLPQAPYNPYSSPTPAPRARIPKPPKAPRYKNKSSRKSAQPVNRAPNPSPYYHHLQSLFSAIPPVYDDVTMNVNFDKKKRKRRGAPAGGDKYGDKSGDAAYNHWYQYTYLPWYHQYQAEMNQYYKELQAYEAAKLAASIPSNPFGNPGSGMGNKFYTYSKQAYNNHLYEQVAGTDPTVTHAEAFAKWNCERESTRTLDPLFIDFEQPCWIDSTATEAGQCSDEGAQGDGTCNAPA